MAAKIRTVAPNWPLLVTSQRTFLGTSSRGTLGAQSSELLRSYSMILLILLAGVWAGIQNALAGGGSFITLPALIFSGLSPLQANITSTVALFPGQVATGLANRGLVSGTLQISFRMLFMLSLIGGGVGGLLLLYTPESVFARLVPWLVLFATLVFARGNFVKPASSVAHLGGVHRDRTVLYRRLWWLLRRGHWIPDAGRTKPHGMRGDADTRWSGDEECPCRCDECLCGSDIRILRSG